MNVHGVILCALFAIVVINLQIQTSSKHCNTILFNGVLL